MENKISKIKRLILLHLKYFWNVVTIRKKLVDGKVSCIIFSRDRAMQLEVLLLSIQKYSIEDFPIIVQYSCSSNHESSYNRLITKFSNVNFIKEDRFRSTLLEILKSVKTRYLFFLVDDQVFIRDFKISQLLERMERRTIASLRLGTNISNWGIRDVEYHPQYVMDGEFIRWKWRKNTYDFRYQFSVDATIYHTIDVLRCSMAIPFKAPNSYEANMNSVYLYKINNDGIAFKQQKVINLIINASRVESGYEQCESGEYTADDMLKLYQEGRVLDIDKISAIKYNSAHHIINDINTILD